MDAPWVHFPTYQLGSIVWRMGAVEEYWYDFQRWFGRLEPQMQTEFQARWPEPSRWQGYYQRALQQHREMTERGHVPGLQDY